MKTIVVKQGQSVADVILTAYGTMSAEDAFCQANDLALSDSVATGAVLAVPDYAGTDGIPALKVYARRKMTPGNVG